MLSVHEYVQYILSDVATFSETENALEFSVIKALLISDFHSVLFSH